MAEFRPQHLNYEAKTIGVAGYLGRNGKNYWVQQFKR